MRLLEISALTLASISALVSAQRPWIDNVTVPQTVATDRTQGWVTRICESCYVPQVGNFVANNLKCHCWVDAIQDYKWSTIWLGNRIGNDDGRLVLNGKYVFACYRKFDSIAQSSPTLCQNERC